MKLITETEKSNLLKNIMEACALAEKFENNPDLVKQMVCADIENTLREK